MNFFEIEIARYERRMQRIGNTPDPTKLQCNGLLYEMWRDYRVRQLQDWKDGKPFAYLSGGGISPRLYIAMGLRPIHLLQTGDRAVAEAKKYFAAARGDGYPGSTCDRVQVSLGLGITGDIPAPSVVLVDSTECNALTGGALALGRHYGCPMYTLDGAMEDNYETIRYVVAQFEDMIDYIEKHVPGAKFDQDKLIELQERQKAADRLIDDIQNIKKAVPCPISGQDSMRMPSQELINDPRYVEYFRRYRDELAERAAKKIGALPDEKLRVMWLVSSPFYADPFGFLAKLGVAVPQYEAGVGARAPWELIGDEQHYGRKLTPLEEEARVMSADQWAGPADRRVEKVLRQCRELHIDALIHFMLSGCLTNLGSAKILADAAEKELGIPSLMIEGWCLDVEKFNQAEFEGKLRDFVDVCLVRKQRRPTLVN